MNSYHRYPDRRDPIKNEKEPQLQSQREIDLNDTNFDGVLAPVVIKPTEHLIPDREVVVNSHPKEKGDVKKRSPITVQKKLHIIKFQKENRTISNNKLAKIFNVPRTTLIGIIKNQESTLKYAAAAEASESTQRIPIKNTKRIVDSRSPTVEAALVFWLRSLKNRGVVVSDKKICTQANEIHRLLSITGARMSGCHYTTGWIQGFKTRHRMQLDAGGQYSSTLGYAWETKVIRWKLYEYDPNDIYTCGLTSIFLSAAPVSNTTDGMMAQTDHSSASVILSCNASGKHRLDPFVVFRNESSDNVSHSKIGEINSSFFSDWLSEFDASISRSILLLVDTDLWSLIKQAVEMDLRLQFVKVVTVPDSLRLHMPMDTKLLKEFKAHYHAQLFHVAPNMITSALGTHEPYINLISKAWSLISDSMINKYFQNFLEKGGLMHYHSKLYFQHSKSNGETGDEKLRQALKTMVLPEVEIDRYQYYTNQDGDTGPSSAILAFLQKLTQNQLSTNLSAFKNTGAPLPIHIV